MEDVRDNRTVTTDQESRVSGGTGPFNGRTGKNLQPPTVTTEKTSVSGSGNGDSTVDLGPKGRDDEENKYSSDESEDEEDPDSTEIIHIDSFSFFFQRDSPAKLTDDHIHLQNIDGSSLMENLNESVLPQQKFEIVVHNECIINYGPYADDLRTKLMASFLPFMYQHRDTTPLIPTMIGEYFPFATLDIIIKFDEPRFPLNHNMESYSDTASSLNSGGSSGHGGNIKHERLKSPHFNPNNPNHHNYNIPWYIFNVPFSANIDDEAKQLDEESVIDNHLMQIKFGANSLIKISIPWIVPDTNKDRCDYTTIDFSLTPCNISSSIRKSELYHSIIDTDKFVMKYKWTTPLKWNDLQKHEIDLTLEKIDRISSIYFLSEHINVFRSLSRDWMSYRPEVTIEYFVPTISTIKLHAKESEIVTSINEFNVIHIESPSKFSFLSQTPTEFLDNPANARLKWKGIIDMELNLPATDWKPSVSNMKLLLEMKIAELYIELPSEHPFTDMMPNKKKNKNAYHHYQMYDDDWCQCLKFRKAKFEMNYIYHNIYYREHRDSMNISIDITDPEFKVYGHFIRYYWNFIQNYSGTFGEFLTMEEFRSEYKYYNTTSLDKRKKLQNTGEKINSYEVYTQISISNASLILPSSIIGTTNNTNYQQKMMNKKNLKPRVKFQQLMFDFRSTDEYNNMYIHSSPIRCMIPLTEQEQSNTKSMNMQSIGNTFLSIDSFTLKRQAWNGLPPQCLTYSQTINSDVGKIKIQLFDCQLQRLVHSINAFMLQYENSFDSRCFDFREKEHILLSPSFYTNDNPDEINYPSKELSIMNINFDIKSIDISIHHNVNMFRYQHITRCIMPYGIQIKSTSESTLEFAQKTVINCNKIELQHLISTTKPNAFNGPNSKDNEEKKYHDDEMKHNTPSRYNQQKQRIRNRRGQIRDERNRSKSRGRTKRGTHGSQRQHTPSKNNNSNNARDRSGSTRRRKKNSNKSNKNKVKDDLLCVGSLDSHFQIILTTERSDQEMYHSKQRNFENRQLQQTEDDVEMDQDWPFHLLNTIYMQEPLPKQRSPNRNPKMPIYQQTELEYELYGRHNDYVPQKRTVTTYKKKQGASRYNPEMVIEEEEDDEDIAPNPNESPIQPPPNTQHPSNPFDSDDGEFFDDAQENKDDDSVGTGLIVKGKDDKQMTTADEDSDSFHSAEEFHKSPRPTSRQQTPNNHPKDNNVQEKEDTGSPEAGKLGNRNTIPFSKAASSHLTTPSPDTASTNNPTPPTISTQAAESV